MPYHYNEGPPSSYNSPPHPYANYRPSGPPPPGYPGPPPYLDAWYDPKGPPPEYSPTPRWYGRRAPSPTPGYNAFGGMDPPSPFRGPPLHRRRYDERPRSSAPQPWQVPGSDKEDHDSLATPSLKGSSMEDHDDESTVVEQQQPKKDPLTLLAKVAMAPPKNRSNKKPPPTKQLTAKPLKTPRTPAVARSSSRPAPITPTGPPRGYPPYYGGGYDEYYGPPPPPHHMRGYYGPPPPRHPMRDGWHPDHPAVVERHSFDSDHSHGTSGTGGTLPPPPPHEAGWGGPWGPPPPPPAAPFDDRYHPSHYNNYAQHSPPESKTILRKKFSWKHYPELEAFLIENRDDYLEHSSRNYTIAQKQFNNMLTERLLAVAEKYNYMFSPEDFNFVGVRDRIRCYYKSYVQTIRKRGLPLPGNLGKKKRKVEDKVKDESEEEAKAKEEDADASTAKETSVEAVSSEEATLELAKGPSFESTTTEETPVEATAAE